MTIFQIPIADRGHRSEQGNKWWKIVSDAFHYFLAILFIIPAVAFAGRVTDGQQVLYTFEEGSGTVVQDVSGVGSPLNLTISQPAAVQWVPGGLVVSNDTFIRSAVAASKVITAIKNSDALTVEAWVIPANVTQSGARIVTLSSNSTNVNFALKQGTSTSTDSYNAVLRTSKTNSSGDSLKTPAGTVNTRLMHVVYTRDATGNGRVYIDGVQQATKLKAGNLDNWNNGYRLGLASEMSSASTGEWLGEYRLVAIYDRALSAGEVGLNYAAGPDPGAALRIVTWNILRAEQTSPIRDMGDIADVISVYDADVVCLQEVPEASLGVDEPTTDELLTDLKDRLGMDGYVYGPTEFKWFNNAVLYRGTLLESHNYQMVARNSAADSRSFVWAKVRKGTGDTINAICTHLSTGSQTDNTAPGAVARVAQVNEINAVASQLSGLVAIGGDFNHINGASSKIRADELWDDCYDMAVNDGAATTTAAEIRDYIYVVPQSGGQTLCAAIHVVDDLTVSDHRPVYGDIRYTADFE